MSTAGTAEPPEPGGPRSGFAQELRAAFGRLAPQGTARWNFGVVFTVLESRFGRRPAAGPAPSPPAPPRPEAGPAPRPVGKAHQLVRQHLVPRVEPWFEIRARRIATEIAATGLSELREGTVEPLVERVDGGFEASVEAFRFLAARVDALEEAAARRQSPVDGGAWLIEPADLGPWVAPVAHWLAGRAGRGPVLHAECGTGALLSALTEAGVAAEGVEPRGPAAWAAAERGQAVELGPVTERLAARAPESLGGLVLSGVVERLAVDQVVALVALAAERLAPGAPLVVVSARPEVVASGWPAVARDLLPGRPLHPETWELLVARAGLSAVSRLEAEGDPASYGLTARRPA